MAEAEATARHQPDFQPQPQQPPWMRKQDAQAAAARAERQRAHRQQQAGGGAAALMVRAQTQASGQIRQMQSALRGWQQPRGDGNHGSGSQARILLFPSASQTGAGVSL